MVAKDANIVTMDGKKMYESSDDQMSSTPSYSSQRKERLDDAIFDYLSDESTNAQQTYDDLINSIKSDAAYFKKYYEKCRDCLLYTSPSPRDRQKSRMPSSA